MRSAIHFIACVSMAAGCLATSTAGVPFGDSTIPSLMMQDDLALAVGPDGLTLAELITGSSDSASSGIPGVEEDLWAEELAEAAIAQVDTDPDVVDDIEAEDNTMLSTENLNGGSPDLVARQATRAAIVRRLEERERRRKIGAATGMGMGRGMGAVGKRQEPPSTSAIGTVFGVVINELFEPIENPQYVAYATVSTQYECLQECLARPTCEYLLMAIRDPIVPTLCNMLRGETDGFAGPVPEGQTPRINAYRGVNCATLRQRNLGSDITCNDVIVYPA